MEHWQKFCFLCPSLERQTKITLVNRISSKNIDIEITNINPKLFEYILLDLTTTLANRYFDANFTLENVYNHIWFKDNDRTNLDVNNLILLY